MIAASVIMITSQWRRRADRRAARTCRADLEACWREDPCFELIVVDNGSTDDSLRVIDCAELQGAAVSRCVISEPVAGVNFSRNTGLRAARGSLLIFTDSDLHFRSGWLRGYLRPRAPTPTSMCLPGASASARVPTHCRGGSTSTARTREPALSCSSITEQSRGFCR